MLSPWALRPPEAGVCRDSIFFVLFLALAEASLERLVSSAACIGNSPVSEPQDAVKIFLTPTLTPFLLFISSLSILRSHFFC